MTAIENKPKEEQLGGPLYEGDTGRLSFPQRQLLVYLLKGPYLLRSDRPHLWNTLVSCRQELESSLNDLFLTLVMNEDMGLAFCKQANTGELEAPQFLRQFELRFLDSVLLLEMRERLYAADVKAERALISLENMEEILKSFDPASKTNEKTFRAHVSAVIKRMLERKLLLRVSSNTNLFEISPVLKLLFNAEEIQALKLAYIEKAHREEAIADRLGDAQEWEEDDAQ